MFVVLLIGPSHPLRIFKCPYVKSVGRGPISKTIFLNSSAALAYKVLVQHVRLFRG